MAGTGGPAGRAGVIHDLGFRHYGGSRLGRGAVTRALFVDSLRGAFGLGRTARTKVLPVLLLVAIVTPPVIVAIVTAYVELDSLPGGYTDYVLKVQALVGLFVAAAAPASVSRDLRFRVVSLYFSRPLLRIDYVGAKFAALVSAALILMAIPLTVLFIGALLAELPLREQAPDFLRSLGGAAVTALLVGGLALVIAALTPRRGLGVAAIIAVLTVASGVQGTVAIAANENGAETAAGYAGLLSPFTLAHGVQSTLFGGSNSTPEAPPGAAGGAIFAAAAVASVAASFAILLARYRRVSI